MRRFLLSLLLLAGISATPAQPLPPTANNSAFRAARSLSPSYGKTWIVDKGGLGDFTYINEAKAVAAQSGCSEDYPCSIIVLPGVYEERVVIGEVTATGAECQAFNDMSIYGMGALNKATQLRYPETGDYATQALPGGETVPLIQPCTDANQSTLHWGGGVRRHILSHMGVFHNNPFSRFGGVYPNDISEAIIHDVYHEKLEMLNLPNVTANSSTGVVSCSNCEGAYAALSVGSRLIMTDNEIVTAHGGAKLGTGIEFFVDGNRYDIDPGYSAEATQKEVFGWNIQVDSTGPGIHLTKNVFWRFRNQSNRTPFEMSWISVTGTRPNITTNQIELRDHWVIADSGTGDNVVMAGLSNHSLRGGGGVQIYNSKVQLTSNASTTNTVMGVTTVPSLNVLNDVTPIHMHDTTMKISTSVITGVTGITVGSYYYNYSLGTITLGPDNVLNLPAGVNDIYFAPNSTYAANVSIHDTGYGNFQDSLRVPGESNGSSVAGGTCKYVQEVYVNTNNTTTEMCVCQDDLTWDCR